MKIYHDNRTRSLRVVWMAEEMGLQYEIVPAELGSPALLAVNPSGTLPAFEDGNVRITESMAIVQYLAGRYGPTPLTPGPEDTDYAPYLQFLWLGEASLAAPMTTKILNQVFAPAEQRGGWILEHSRASLPRRLTLVNDALELSPYIAGQRFTAADISVFYALNLLEFVELSDSVSPRIKDYRERIKARPAFQRALAAS